jgi:hypothetical protein
MRLPELLDGFRIIAPAERGVPVRDKTSSIGHLSLEFREGVVYPLHDAADTVVGLYFEGTGYYDYTTGHEADRRILETNLQRNAPALEVRDEALRDRFPRLVLCFGTSILSDIWDTGANAEEALQAGSRSSFEKLWDHILDTEVELDHSMAEARLSDGALQHVWVEIPGDKANVAYELDGVQLFEERLYAFQRYGGVGRRFVRVLSRQPLPVGDTSPIAWNLKHTRIEVAAGDNRSGTINSELTLEAARDGLRVAVLSLMNNRDPYTYNWDSEKNALQVHRVVDEDGSELAFSHRYHDLLIQLPRTLSAGDQIRLRVETSGRVFTAMDGSTDDNYFALFTVTWFPHPLVARWDTTPFTFELDVRTPKPYYPIASGRTISFDEDKQQYHLVTKSDNPVDSISVFAGKYKVLEESFDGLTIRVHAYAMSNKFIMKNLPGLASELVRFYSDHLGPYPFDELDIVEVPDYGFGIAPPGMVLITSEAYNPNQDYIAGYLARGAPALLAHEIAHQWFGYMASPGDITDNWLAESFAEYVSGLAMGAGQTKETRVFGFKRMFADWQADARHCASAGSIETASMLTGPEGARNRRCLLYSRGPLVLHMLRSMVGEERFYAILRTFLENANYGQVTTEDFKAAIRQVLRTDLDWFVDQWYRQGGIPEVYIDAKITRAEGGGFLLSGRVEQADGPQFKKIMLPFVLTYPSGERELKLLFQEQPVQDFSFAIAGKPKSVKVDPAENNLAVYH